MRPATILDFTLRRGSMPPASGEKGSRIPGGRSGRTTDLASRALFFIRRFRGCWGRRWAFWGGGLCGEPLRAAGHLHAQRFCGVAGVRADADADAGGAADLRVGGETRKFAAAGDGVLR